VVGSEVVDGMVKITKLLINTVISKELNVLISSDQNGT
jgi:hypothetical protein